MAPVIQNNLTESLCSKWCHGAKKVKLDEPAISDILAADTDSEITDKASDLEDEFYEF
jgi:hypothetical protein